MTKTTAAELNNYITNYNRKHGLTAYAAKLAERREAWLREQSR